ncbi:MAG: hypothetical protein AAF565_11075, partial [Pseudomonadota bacterium]
DPYDEPEPDTDIFEENDREDLDRLAEDERDEDEFAFAEEGDPDGGDDRFAEKYDREELDRLAELERDEDDFTFADEDEFSADEDPLADAVEDDREHLDRLAERAREKEEFWIKDNIEPMIDPDHPLSELLSRLLRRDEAIDEPDDRSEWDAFEKEEDLADYLFNFDF